jgi:transposase
MRGEDRESGALFSYVSCEARVPADHPLRPIRAIVDEALEVLSPAFERLYAKIGRPSIPPEKLLRALLLQAFFTIRSERQLMEQLDYNLLFRWFVGLAMDAPVWDASTYSKNRDRLIAGEVAARFVNAVLQGERVKALLSDDHFSVDGTLIDAWASIKSFRPKGGGDDEELPPGPKRRARLPRPEAVERDPRVDDRPGRPALPQGRRAVEPAVLHGPSADREPQRADRRRRTQPRHRHGRARGGAGDVGSLPEAAADHARRRQGLRRERLRR